MRNQQLIDLSNVRKFFLPFHYVESSQALNSQLGDTLLSWLENYAGWKLVETNFYEQYEFSFLDAKLPSELAFLNSRDHLRCVARQVEAAFSVKLTEKVDFTAHKLISGQRIRIHNDHIPGHETHRLLIQLNRGWKDENGGMLIFFNSQDMNDIHKIFRPLHNSAVGFSISPHSLHAVSTIYGGERFTLVYSFYQQLDERPS
ncbi:cyclophane-containing peptide 2OG-Fe(II) oxygenase YhhC [Nitrosospira sp. NRS527]|uniref:cyclophane-containing peptide 2OG-Fe(II) oxygenase YhhC n=1 Tax=Nitrosospira sp. NRS527 TaxID=155925 RepID=UPI001AFC2117|nr:cyclophane-containing peptide 2OG-Fe(II) oxygenase YhhC [Nitrosospira sp. NRS527]BCT69465.1 hypothetical protein NNRS527_03089 [Nitrosospira sp. NRS527]